jgi:putative addiction module component (TIGR02574 family)
MISSDDIAELSPTERLRLIGDLWDSISDADAPLPPAQREELLRRLSNFDRDKTDAANWQDLKAELDARRR